MNTTQISSDRLILIPFTINIATSVLNRELEVLEKLGIKIDKNWPDSETIEVLPKIIKNLEIVKEPTGFESWMIIKKDNMTVIGDAGFKGKPNASGEVDIGYAVIETDLFWLGMAAG
jgi:ribosomal-protein-alanine N-acetyltransferase